MVPLVLTILVATSVFVSRDTKENTVIKVSSFESR